MKSKLNCSDPLSTRPSRRMVMKLGVGAFASTLIPQDIWAGESGPFLSRRIHKSLKIGMVGVGDSMVEKFEAAKRAGFAGIEPNLPGDDVEQLLLARDETGLFIDGSVCATHWHVRHSSPDPDVRKQALADLNTAIRQTHRLGGHTVLLVPGNVTDAKNENEKQCWDRSVANIRQAIPIAAELGIVIAIENVWNRFLYDHGGPNNQTADKMAQYIDTFQSPFVGAQFDIGNHQKYGQPGDWIRLLGKRIVKLDVKDWSVKNNFTKIGEGDVDWIDVRRALQQIHFHGWAAAEVGGGDLTRLKEISRNMDKALGLA